MKNLPFVIWMLCFLPIMQLEDHISVQTKILRNIPTEVSKDALGATAIVTVFIWVIVGFLLYER